MRPDPRVGTDLGPYRIVSVIGRGGMGVVYLAEQPSLGRKVALKVIAPEFSEEPRAKSRFLRESQMAAAIDHPNILPIHEAGEIEGVLFIAMRYVEGEDLERRLRRGPIEPRAAVAILGQVASALDAAHGTGLVHRDVKPANVLIASGQGADRSDHAYLTDFGLTRPSGSETGLTRAGGFVGTLEYIAPEQIEGKAVDGQADQYALAAIAVACLTGQVPFPRDSDVAIINAHLHDPPPSMHGRVSTLPGAADPVIARGMAKAPHDRYPDCRAFVEDLGSGLGVTATTARSIPMQDRDRRLPLIVGGLVVVALLAAIGTLMASGGAVSPTSSPSATLAALSPSVVASPTEDVFPNAAEAALLARLPADLQKTCARGPYDVVTADQGPAGGPAGKPLASLRCSPAIAAGANDVVARTFEQRTGSSGTGDFNTEGMISRISRLQGLGPGDCASSGRAVDRWQLGDADAGAMACYVDSTTGDAVLYWSYKDGALLVKATNQKGDSEALYGFFSDVARFITP